MKMNAFALTLTAICLPFTACESKGKAGKAAKMKNETDTVSYIIGLDVGRQFKRMDASLNLDQVMSGIRTSMDTAAKPLISDSQIQVVMMAWQQKMMQAQMEKNQKKGEDNKKAGEDFLAKNAKAQGVKVTASGLQYQVLQEGAGKTPTAQDTVVCHYKGTLIDGKEFDSSAKHGQPATFPVSGVIPGWTEALQLMKEGAKYRLFIPSGLAYGERGAGESIGPNSTLIFDIELLQVKSAAAAPAAPGAKGAAPAKKG